MLTAFHPKSLKFTSLQRIEMLRQLELVNLQSILPLYRSSQRRCSIKKCVLRNFAKFTGKHQCQSLFFNKVAGFIKNETLAQVFSCEFCEISRKSFSTEQPQTTAGDDLIEVTSFLG